MSIIPYICVLDFEATCIDQPCQSFYNEIIEFPSVMLKWDKSIQNYKEIGRFQKFCKPLHNSKLSKFCTELTGITQDQVDAGDNFYDVMEEHHQWMIHLIPELQTFEYDDHCPVVISTCGDWDLLEMMVNECRRWNVIPRPIYRKFINMKKPFKEVYASQKKMGMVDMLKRSNLNLIGRHHSGIDDCHNISRIIQHTAEKGHQWTYDQMTMVSNSKYK